MLGPKHWSFGTAAGVCCALCFVLRRLVSRVVLYCVVRLCCEVVMCSVVLCCVLCSVVMCCVVFCCVVFGVLCVCCVHRVHCVM